MTTENALLAASDLAKELSQIERAANAITVRDEESWKAAGEFCREVKTFQARVSKRLDPLVEKAHAAHKEACALRNELLNPSKRAEDTIKQRMSLWYTADLRRKEADAAREQSRLEREAEDRQLEEARRLELAGRLPEAEKLIDTPIAAPLVIAEPAAEAEGVQMRESWDFTVVNIELVPMQYFTLDETAVIRDVRRLKERAEQAIPGIKVTMRMVPAVSAY